MAITPPAKPGSDPTSPPPPPAAATYLSASKPLLKVGLHKPAVDWLTTRPGYRLLSRMWRLFDCGGTQSLTLAVYEAKIFNPTSGLFETCWVKEAADQLIEMPKDYNLLCNLEYMLGNVPLTTAGWQPQQLDPAIAWDQKKGQYSWPKSPGSNILATTVWSYSYINPVGPFPAPMPRPALDSDITILETGDGSTIVGYVRFHQNLDTTLNFTGDVYWTCTTQTPCRFSFPVPTAASNKSFLPTAFTASQALTASVAPTGDVNVLRVTTSAWTSGAGTFRIQLEKNNIP